jgi:arabinofuranosyltransferase
MVERANLSNPRPNLNSIARQLQKPQTYLLLAILFLGTRSVQMYRPYILIDDAYISFRYAQNFALGKGLVFNPGERVEGYTNFLWTVLMAGGAKSGLGFTAASVLLSAASATGTLVLIYLTGRRLFASQPGGTILTAAPMLVFAVMGSQARYVVSGMETLLFTFLVSLGVYLFLFSGKPFLSGLSFALSALARPEGIMYFGLAWGSAALMSSGVLKRILPEAAGEHSGVATWRRGELLSFSAGFLLLFGPYFTWRYAYYGYPLPNTYYAKAYGFHWDRIQRGWSILLATIDQWALLPLLALALFSLFSLRKRSAWPLFWLMVAATCAYFIYVGGDFTSWFGPRFLMPCLPLLLALAMQGLAVIASALPLPTAARLWGQLGVSVLVIAGAYLYSWPTHSLNLGAFAAQMQGWAELGQWLRLNTPTDTTIATDAAGLIPFISQRYSIDMFGLTDEHIAHLAMTDQRPGIVAHEKYDPEYVLARRPDCVVSTWVDPQGQAISAGLALVSEQFNQIYKLVAVAKTQHGPAENGRWVIRTSDYPEKLYQDGYVTGLFCQPSTLANPAPQAGVNP